MLTKEQIKKLEELKIIKKLVYEMNEIIPKIDYLYELHNDKYFKSLKLILSRQIRMYSAIACRLELELPQTDLTIDDLLLVN